MPKEKIDLEELTQEEIWELERLETNPLKYFFDDAPNTEPSPE